MIERLCEQVTNSADSAYQLASLLPKKQRLHESHVSAFELSICLLNKYPYRPIQSTQGLHRLSVKPKAINSRCRGVWTRYLSEDFHRAQRFQTVGQVPVLLRLTSVHTWGQMLAARSHLPPYITIPSGPMAPDVGPMYVAPPWPFSKFSRSENCNISFCVTGSGIYQKLKHLSDSRKRGASRCGFWFA